MTDTFNQSDTDLPNAPQAPTEDEFNQRLLLKQSKPYAHVVDEYQQYLSNGPQQPLSLPDFAKQMDAVDKVPTRASAYDPNVVQQINDALHRQFSFGGPVPDPSRVQYNYGPESDMAPMPLQTSAPAVGFQPITRAPDYVGKATGMYGALADKALGTTGIEPAMESAGAGVAGALPDIAMMAGGPAGMAAGLSDMSAEAYSPQKDVVSAAMVPLTMAAGSAITPIAKDLAGGAVTKLLSPSVGDIVASPAGTDFLKLVQPNTLTENAISAARIAGSVVANTGLMEASRMATERLKGDDVTGPSIQSLAGSAISSAMFEPAGFGQESPVNYREGYARRTLAQADAIRATQARMDQGRGQRIADTHQAIFDAVKNGQDPSDLMNELTSHYDEAALRQGPAEEDKSNILMSIADNGGKMSELNVANLINSVTGKFDRVVSDDPNDPNAISGAAVLEMVKNGNLPQVSEDFIKKQWPEAYAQALGDEQGARENIVNRIVNHYQKLLPQALEDYRNAPRAEQLTKKTLDAKDEAGKDAAYMQSLVQLMPEMAGKKASDGKTPLDEAMFKRDMDFSNATQGAQLQGESAAWSKYDMWKTNIVKFAQTYDPVTRTGEWTSAVRLSDGSMVQGDTTRVPIEDLTDASKVKAPASGKRMAGKQSLTGRMMEYMDTRANDQVTPEDRTEPLAPGDLSKAADLEETDTFSPEQATLGVGADYVPSEKTPPEVKAAWDEATKAGLEGQQRADYVKKQVGDLAESTKPFFTKESGQSQLEAATFLANRIEKSDPMELWQKYGGKQVFGQGALAPGKAQNFKNALLARIEREALPSQAGRKESMKELTPVQQDFLKTWLKSSGDEGVPKELPKTWREQTQLYRHAERLYWRQIGSRFPDLLKSILADKPELLKQLEGGQDVSGAGEVKDKQGKVVQTYGQTNPLIDSFRVFRGYALDNGQPRYVADHYAAIAQKMLSAFPEVQQFGRLVTDATNLQGINVANKDITKPNSVALSFGKISEIQGSPQQNMVRALEILAHETAHAYTHPRDPAQDSRFQQSRIDAYNRLSALFSDLGPDATKDLLNNVLEDVFTPPQFTKRGKTNLTYEGANFAAESISRLNEMTMLGAFTKSDPAQGQATRGANYGDNPFLWLPQDVQAYTGFAFRDLANFTGGLMSYYDSVIRGDGWTSLKDKSQAIKTRAYLKYMFDYSKDFIGDTLEKSQQYEAAGKRMVAFLQANGSVDMGDPVVTFQSQALDMDALARIAKQNKISFAVSKEPDANGVELGRQLMFDGKSPEEPDLRTEGERRKGVTIPGWSKMFGQFYQAMTRYQKSGLGPVAENGMAIVRNLEPSYWRLLKSLHEPFTMIDKNGDMKYDPNHPVQILLKGSHPQSAQGLKALEDLRMWSVDHQKPVVTVDDKGQTVVNPNAQEKVTSSLGKLDPVIQQGVLEGIKSLVQSYQNAGTMRYTAELETVSTQVAKFFMLKDKGMKFDYAFNTAKQSVIVGTELYRAQEGLKVAEENAKQLQAQPQLLQTPDGNKALQELAGARQKLTQTTSEYANVTQGLSPEQTAVLQNYLLNPGGAAQGLNKMADLFAARKDWFMSEQRPGQFLINGKTPEGAQYTQGKKTKSEADKLVRDLSKEGYQELSIKDRSDDVNNARYDSPDQVVNDFLDIEHSSWQNFLSMMKEKLSDEDYKSIEDVGYEPGVASAKVVQSKSLDRYLMPNKKVAGRESLNSFEVFNDYTKRLVGSVARRGTTSQADLYLRDPRVKGNEDFQNFYRDAVRTLMLPVGDKLQALRAGLSAYFLGSSLITPTVEATQSLTTVLPDVVKADGSYTGGIRRFSEAPINVYKYHDSSTTLEGKKLMSSALAKELDNPTAMTKEESYALYYKRAKDEGSFSHGVVQQSLSKDADLMTQQAFGMGMKTSKSAKELASDVYYRAVQLAMGLYTPVSAMNNKVAFMAGLDLYYDKGYRGTDLYDKANIFKDQATFGGGKTNEVGYVAKLSNPSTRSWFSLINTLQRFGFGNVTARKDEIADIIGNTKLSPGERLASAKALSTAMAAQFALGGAIAIPGVAITAAIMDKLGHWDMKQGLRDFWKAMATRLGADDLLANQFANVAQTGIGGQFLGVDLSSRFTMNSFLGFDAYEGFNATDNLGPSMGAAERLFKAGQYVGQGQMVKATQQLVPPNLSNMVDFASQTYHGEQPAIRNARGDLIRNLTPSESVRFALGAKPDWYRQYRDLQTNKRISEQATNSVRDQKVDEAATALRSGNPQPASDWVNQMMTVTPTANRADLMKAIIDRGLVQSNASDLLATSVQGNEQNLQHAASTFGDAGSRQSEVDMLVQREKLNATTGYQGGKPMDYKEITKAALIDAMVGQGMMRSEAVRQVGLMGY